MDTGTIPDRIKRLRMLTSDTLTRAHALVASVCAAAAADVDTLIGNGGVGMVKVSRSIRKECGRVILIAFAAAMLAVCISPALASATYIPPDPTNLANTTSRYWVNYRWTAGEPGNTTDSYNVCMNGTWTNGTTSTSMNVTVGAGGWANITVWAWNASGTGTLSAGCVSDNVQAPATYIPPDPTNLANTTGSYWVNYTWSDGGPPGNVTDSYNVCMNGTWTNDTTDTFMNVTVCPGGWANITVGAWNASGTGTLSTGCVSDDVQASRAKRPPASIFGLVGSSGRGGTYPPGWFETPTPAVTATNATTAPPGERVTPAPTKRPAAAKATAPAAEGTTAGTAKKGAPGFTAVFAIAGMLAVAYAMMRQR